MQRLTHFRNHMCRAFNGALVAIQLHRHTIWICGRAAQLTMVQVEIPISSI